MELSEFVTKTLTQIIGGVADAQEEIRETDLGGEINPGSQRLVDESVTMNEGVLLQRVEFDIALTTEDSSGGGGKISVLPLSIGGKIERKEVGVSRIKVCVPVGLPPDTGEQG